MALRGYHRKASQRPLAGGLPGGDPSLPGAATGVLAAAAWPAVPPGAWPLRLGLAAVGALGLAAVGVSGYVGWMFTHLQRHPTWVSPEELGLAYEEVSFPSRQGGLLLSGWFMPAGESDRAVIFAHGYGMNRSSDGPVGALAAALVRQGIHVLAFDFRGHGRSPGRAITLGYFERYDLLGAVDYLRARLAGPRTRVGVLGFSMGAATALLAAGEEPGAIAALVSDSAFADLHSYLWEHMSAWTRLPMFPFTPLILGLTPLLTRARARGVRPVAAVAGLRDLPLLLIAGEADEAIPPANSAQLYQTAPGPHKELWLVPGGTHVGSYAVAPEEYRTRVLSFFQRHLGG